MCDTEPCWGACIEDDQIYEKIRAALDPLLPITVKLDAVQLVAHDDNHVRPLKMMSVAP